MDTRFCILTAPIKGRSDIHGYELYDCERDRSLGIYENRRDAIKARDNVKESAA